MTRTTKHGLFTHRFRILRERDECERMIGLDDELAAFNDVHLANYTFAYACELYPTISLRLMHWSRVMIEHPAPEPSERAK